MSVTQSSGAVTLTDEQQAFVESIRDFAKRECGTREQRDALTDNGREVHNRDLYHRLAELGWLGASIPETYGGSGEARSTCACCSRSRPAARSRWAFSG